MRRASFVIGAMLLLCCEALPHPEHGDYLQHRITFTATAEHTDLVLEISFDAARSLEERERIDADHDGTLSSVERDAYLKDIQREADTQLRVLVNSRPVKFLALYNPELDLLGSRDMERHPHVVRLFFFSSEKIASGDSVTVHDALWPNHPAIVLAEAGNGQEIRLLPRPVRSGSGLVARTNREVGFEAVRATASEKAKTGHVCTAACRHTFKSKGRPGGHRTE